MVTFRNINYLIDQIFRAPEKAKHKTCSLTFCSRFLLRYAVKTSKEYFLNRFVLHTIRI